MNYNIVYMTILVFLLVFPYESLKAQNSKGSGMDRSKDLWQKIEPYFTSPNKYKNEYGSYRSPLKFYNGDTVTSTKEWKERRKEVLNKWNEMMGDWPDFIKNQRFQILDSVQRDNFMQYTVKFRWLPDQYTEGYLLIPEGDKKKPAVITVFYEPETAVGYGKSSSRAFAYQLAKRGFVTLSLGTKDTTEDKTYSLYYPDIDDATIQPLSTLAYAAANAWYALSQEPQVDSSRIGIMGHSYGGKWAMFASTLFDKFAAAVWSDPGIVFDETKGSLVNYWEPWYLGYYPPPWENAWRKKGMIADARGLYPKLIKKGFDLHELHALMAPRPFLVSGGESDREKRWIPLNWTIKVNRLLGYKNRVAMTNREHHSPTAESNEKAFDFLEYFLKNEGDNTATKQEK